jgi:hypothetical protein
MNDWMHWQLSQLQNDVREMRSDIRSLRTRFDELTTWAQRLCLLVLLWGAGIVVNGKPEAIGEALGAALRSLK